MQIVGWTLLCPSHGRKKLKTMEVKKTNAPWQFEGDATNWVLKHVKQHLYNPLYIYIYICLKAVGALDMHDARIHMNMIEYGYRLPYVSSVQSLKSHFQSPNTHSWRCAAPLAALHRLWCAVAATNQLRWRRQVWQRQSAQEKPRRDGFEGEFT